MKTTILHILLAILPVLFYSPKLEAQPISFEHIGEREGFPGGSVLCLLQDQIGFIWIGTTDGLFRWDGHKFLEFRSDNKDSTSISNNYIKCMHEDKNGNIWIGTTFGLNRYIVKEERFERIIKSGEENLMEAENNIHSIVTDKQGFLWYGTYNGLFRRDLEKKEVLQFMPQIENPNSITHKNVWKVFESQDGRLWLGTGNGLAVYKNDGTFKFERHLPEPNASRGLKTERIWEIVEQPNGTIWLGTNKGIYRAIENGPGIQFQAFEPDSENPNSLSHGFIERMMVDGDSTIWACTFDGGLNKITVGKSNIQFDHFKHDPKNELSLRANYVTCTLKDHAGNIWVGTNAGLDKISHAKNKFGTLRSDIDNPTSLSDPIVKSFLVDRDGNLWIGTRYGLNFLEKEKFQNKEFEFERFYHKEEDPNSLSHSNIFGICQDSFGIIWIGTYNGLNYLSRQSIEDFIEKNTSLSFGHFSVRDGLPHNFIRNFHEINAGQMWVLTYGQLSKMTYKPDDVAAAFFKNYDMDDSRADALVNASTMVAEKDRFGDVWIGTFNGLSKYKTSPGREFFENYKHVLGDPISLSNNSITDMLLDSKQRLWVATRGGLNLVQQDSPNDKATFISFGSADGFANDVIQSIEEDHSGNLWLGTNRGLALFDPDQEGQKVVNTYYENDGLASNSFVFRASFKDMDGQLFFGTSNGANIFHPEKLKADNNTPKIILTQLRILNQIVKPARSGSVLEKSITLTSRIDLNYRQNMIEIEFAALDFSNTVKNQFAYKMAGVNEDWVIANGQNSASFTNLSPGNYLFEVRGRNEDGTWPDDATPLLISIAPPPWKTWWAYLSYALLFCLSIYGFIKMKLNKKIKKMEVEAAMEKAKMEERELLRKQNAADFHDELGHRLTKISLFLELATRESGLSSTVKNLLNKVGENAAGLSVGMRDLIWTLDPKSDSLFQTTLRLSEFGDKLFEASDIQFSSHGILESHNQISLPPDVRKHALLIFKEAMHNALKYSGAKTCELNTIVSGAEISLSLKDDGVGFDPTLKANGYGLRNMVERSKKIPSQLTILSTPSNGTTILLTLNLTQMG